MSDNKSHLRGHEFKGSIEGEGTLGAKDTYTSTISMSHPTIRPKTNYPERKRGGTSVPVPPELKLP